jgi:hypothetical protein
MALGGGVLKFFRKDDMCAPPSNLMESTKGEQEFAWTYLGGRADQKIHGLLFVLTLENGLQGTKD